MGYSCRVSLPLTEKGAYVDVRKDAALGGHCSDAGLYSNARPSSCSSCETSLWCKRARSAHEGVLAVVLEHGSSVWRKRQDTDLNSELRQTHVELKSAMRNNCSCPAGHHMSFSSKKSLTIQEVRVLLI